MTQGDLVQSLLEIEEKASAIVSGAQKKVDKMLIDADMEIRGQSEAALKKAFDELNSDYEKEIEAAKKSYNEKIEEYEKLMESAEVFQDEFSHVFSEYLFDKGVN